MVYTSYSIHSGVYTYTTTHLHTYFVCKYLYMTGNQYIPRNILQLWIHRVEGARWIGDVLLDVLILGYKSHTPSIHTNSMRHIPLAIIWWLMPNAGGINPIHCTTLIYNDQNYLRRYHHNITVQACRHVQCKRDNYPIWIPLFLSRPTSTEATTPR